MMRLRKASFFDGCLSRPANDLRMRQPQSIGNLDEALPLSDIWQVESRDKIADCDA